MTVIVGALCEGRKCAVLAADRLESFGSGLQTELDTPKIIELSPAILAGGAYGDRAGREVMRWLKTRVGKDSTPLRIAKAIHAKINKSRSGMREDVYRDAFNLDTDEFAKRLFEQPNSPELKAAFSQAMSINTGASFVVAGAEGPQMRLFAVLVQEMTDSTDLGFVAVGSGTACALIQLMQRRYSTRSTLPEAILAIYEAKKGAEIASGVGCSTDMVVLRHGAHPLWLSPENLLALEAMREKRKPRPPSAREASEIRRMLE